MTSLWFKRDLAESYDFMCKYREDTTYRIYDLLYMQKVDFGGLRNKHFGRACYGGNLECVKLAIKRNATDFEYGFLWSHMNGHWHIVKYITDECSKPVYRVAHR